MYFSPLIIGPNRPYYVSYYPSLYPQLKHRVLVEHPVILAYTIVSQFLVISLFDSLRGIPSYS